MKAIVGVVALMLFTTPLAAARVEIVLDVSGSMRAPAGNVSRMQAVKATIGAIDAGINVALRLHGHRLPSESSARAWETWCEAATASRAR